MNVGSCCAGILKDVSSAVELITANATTAPWFALKVRARNELMAATALRGKDYDCFVPTYPERRTYSDRVKQIESALFPGYVFCRFDPRFQLPILTTPGVQYVVCFGKIPRLVDPAEMDAIQRIVQSGLLAKPWPYLRMGQRVRIGEGPLSGIEGLLLREKGQNRLIVSVPLLQRSVSVELNRYAIRPL